MLKLGHISKTRSSLYPPEYLPIKLGDIGRFVLPVPVNQSQVICALADLESSVNIIPYYLFQGLDNLRPIKMDVTLSDQTIRNPRGFIENIEVRIKKFKFLTDFVILDIPEDPQVPIILGRPFLHTTRTIIDLFM